MYFIIRDADIDLGVAKLRNYAIHAGAFDSMAQARGVEGCEQGDRIVSADTGRVMFHISTNGKWEKLRHLRILSGRIVKEMQECVLANEKANVISSRNDVELQDAIDEAKRPQAADMVNAPPHYNQAGIECVDAIAAATSGKTGIEAVCVANVVKYLWRYELKNGVEDVKKARWYLDRLIGELEK